MNDEAIIIATANGAPGVYGWHYDSALAIYRAKGLEDALTWLKSLGDLRAPMPCGHPRAALRWNVHATADTTHYCSICEATNAWNIEMASKNQCQQQNRTYRYVRIRTRSCQGLQCRRGQTIWRVCTAE